MRVPLLALGALLASSVWAQLPLSFSGNAGDACAPAQDPFIQAWPGTADPASSVRFAWSATNTTNDPIPLQVSVYRDAYFTGTGTIPEVVVHSFSITVAPNGTSTGESYWPCAYDGFQQLLAHSVRVSGPSGTCTAFSITVEDSPGAFGNDAEPNNSSSQFITAAPNTYYEGHLRYNGATDADWYRIDLPINGVLRIEFEGEQPSTSTGETIELRLSFTTGTVRSITTVPLGADRNPLATNVDVPCMGSEGVYDLRLQAVSGCDISYRFRYVVLPTAFPTDAEPNNGTPGGGGSPVAHDTYQDGQINFDFQGGTDLFNIVAPFNGVMNFEVQAEHAGASPGTMEFRVYTTAGSTIQLVNVPAGANGTPATTTFSIPCRSFTTDYDIGIDGVTCGVSYRWKYWMSPPAFANDAEPNNSSGGSTEAHNTWYEGQIGFDNQTDDDLYNLVPPFNGVMNIEVEAEHAGATEGTLEVTLFTTAGTTIQQWIVPVGASGTPTASTLTQICRSNTTDYDLRFRDLTCGTSYRWRYVMTPPVFANDVEPNGSSSQAIVLPPATQATGHLNFDNAENNDYYRINMPEDGVLNVTIEAEHAGASTTETITANITISVGTNQGTWPIAVGANSTPSSTTFTLSCRGTAIPYYLQLVSNVCGASYRVSWTVTPPVFANDPEPNNGSPGTAMNLNNAEQQGHIGFHNTTDDDFYAFTHPGGPWSVTVSAEHANAGAGTMGMRVSNSVGTTFGTFSVPVGGSSTPLTNTFTLPSLAAGSLYRLNFWDETCGVSYRIHCYDADNDGTCNGFDLCAGGPEPGTPCDDFDACTINDVIQAGCNCAGTPTADSDGDGACDSEDPCPTLANVVPGQSCDDGDACTTGDVIGTNCLCAGTFADADNDGTCDANDLCPGGPEPGTACNDNDACTTGDVIGTNCLCAGTFADADNDGTCDANDLCPGGPEPGTACNDNDACTTGDVIGTNCLCAGTFADADNDGTCDANDLCPGGPEPGTACNDNNANTINDVIGTNCLCAGTPTGGGCTTNELTLSLETDGLSNTTWEVRAQGSGTIVASGGQLYPDGSFTEPICLPDGCYYLRVLDDGGDGIIGGGYILRDAADKRIIDNRGNFSSGSESAILNNGGFCLPLGNDRLVTASCDRLELRRGATGACSDRLTADNTPNGTSGNVYQFWFFDPNGTQSILYPSATGATSNQVNLFSLPSLVEGRMYNVRVRTRISPGVWREWGPACRMRIDNAAGQCASTQLQNAAGVQLSCGSTKPLGNSSASLVYAKPVMRYNANCVNVAANKYQFRFRIPAEGVTIVKNGVGSNPWTYLNMANVVSGVVPSGTVLEACRQYEVEVRASFDGGATWCRGTDPYTDLAPWGSVCVLNTDGCSNELQLPTSDSAMGEARFSMYPNPNHGDQLFVSLSNVEESVESINVDIYDSFGKRVAQRTIGVQDGYVSSTIALNGELANGMYLVSIAAGTNTYTERLMIQQ